MTHPALTDPAALVGDRPATGKALKAVARRRVEWADSAKGLSIIGVCLMHVVTAIPGGTETGWGLFSSLLDPLRMPLFFLVSGLFAHRVITRNLEDLWYRRLWFLLVPYLVYTPIQAAIRLNITNELTPWSLVKAVALGDPGLWFLYTLMLYNIAAVVLRHQPPWLAVVISMVPLFVGAFSGLVVEQSFRQSMMYAPVFFLGLHFRTFFFSLSRRASHLPTVAAVALLFVAWEFVFRHVTSHLFTDWSETVAGQSAVLSLVRTFTAVPFGVIIAVWISRTPLLSNCVNFVGRNTLPIYCTHHAALHFVNSDLLPFLSRQNPTVATALESVDVRIYVGFATCFLAGFVFYWVGKTPILGWTLHPPKLPRRNAR